MRIIPLILSLAMSAFTHSPAVACRGIWDVTCNLGRAAEKSIQNTGKTIEKAIQDVGRSISKSSPGLVPVRSYLRADNIPPQGIGGYGILIFRSKPTDTTKFRYEMICQSFVASFPRGELTAIPTYDQMITIWPLDNPDAEEAKNDDCNYVLSHYDLSASELAVRDAYAQHAELDGEGPYLVGWSPASARGNPDKLVLVVDFSGDNSQAAINYKFLFWKNKIVQNPSLWRSGFSMEGLKIAIREFADRYGQSMIDAVRLNGTK